MGEIKDAMQSICNLCLKSDSSRSLFAQGDEQAESKEEDKEAKELRRRRRGLLTSLDAVDKARDDSIAEIQDYIRKYFPETIKNRKTLVESNCPARQVLLDIEKELLAEGRANRKAGSLKWSRKGFIERAMKQMLERFQKQYFKDVMEFQQHVMEEQLNKLMADLDPERQKEITNLVYAYWGFGPIFASCLAAGGGAACIAVYGAYLYGAASLGPPGWIAGLVVGLGGLTAFGYREFTGWWSIESAAESTTDESVKVLAAQRAAFTDKVCANVATSVAAAFDGLKHLRVVRPGECGALGDGLEEMKELRKESDLKVLKLMEVQRESCTVMQGQEPPTTFAKDSDLNVPDFWKTVADEPKGPKSSS
jgi:hypothetical protein